MRLAIISTVLIMALTFMSACTQATRRPPVPQIKNASAQIVEIAIGNNGKYVWGSRTLSREQLGKALTNESKRVPIVEIHLMSGSIESSIGNLLEVALMAKALDAKAMYEHDGKLSSIHFVA